MELKGIFRYLLQSWGMSANVEKLSYVLSLIDCYHLHNYSSYYNSLPLYSPSPLNRLQYHNSQPYGHTLCSNLITRKCIHAVIISLIESHVLLRHTLL